MIHTVFFGQLIFGKIVKAVATRGHILRLKCTKFYFGEGKGREEMYRVRQKKVIPHRILQIFKQPLSIF